MKNIYRNVLLLIVIFLTQQDLFAQRSQYVVFLKDKVGTEFNVSEPNSFLSPRAIERRQKQNIPIVASDLPLSKVYLDQLKNLGFSPVHKSKWMNAILLFLNPAEKTVIENLNFVTKTEYVAPSFQNARLSASKNKFEVASTAGVQKTQAVFNQYQNELLGIPSLHAKGYKGEGMQIAIFDGGFPNVNTIDFFTHLYNDNRILATKDFSRNSGTVYYSTDHGTQVLSIIGAEKENVYSGIAPKASFVLCLTDDNTEYRLDEYTWLFAAEYVDSLGVDIINSSLGYNVYDDPSMDYTFEDMDGNTTVVTKSVNLAASKGILVVNAIGNDGNKQLRLSVPGDAEHGFIVGATDITKGKADFSSYGPTYDGRMKPDVVAYGKGTVLVDKNGDVTTNNGTSFASPTIAGLAALAWQANPSWDVPTLISEIKKTGSQANAPDNYLGHGLPNMSSLPITKELATSMPDSITDGGFTLNVSSHGTLNYSVKILNASSSVVYEQENITSSPVHIQITPKLPNGIYSVEITNHTTLEKSTQNLTVQNLTKQDMVVVNELKLGESLNLSISGSETSLSYRSSNPSILSVTQNGVVTGLSQGIATVIVNAVENAEYSATESTVEIKVIP